MLVAEKEDLEDVLNENIEDKIGEMMLNKNVDLGISGDGIAEGEDFDRMDSSADGMTDLQNTLRETVKGEQQIEGEGEEEAP